MDMEIKPVVDQLTTFGTTYGLQIIGAIIILIVGRIAAGVCRSVAHRLLEKGKADPAIVSFAGSLIYILILTFAILAALAKFGIQTASFVAIQAPQALPSALPSRDRSRTSPRAS